MLMSRRQGSPIGLVIGTRHIKLTQLTRVSAGRYRLSAYNVKPWPFEWPLTDPKDSLAAIKLIRDTIKAYRLVGRRAIVTLPDALFEYRSIRVSGNDPFKISKAAQESAAEILSLDVDQVRCQYLEAGSISDDNGSGWMEVITMAASKEAVDTFSTLLASAQVEATVINVSPHAIVHLLSLVAPQEADSSRLVVNLGHRWTTISITNNGTIQVIRRLPLGLAKADLHIANQLRISVEAAESIRLAVQRLEGTTPTADNWPFQAVAPDKAGQAVNEAIADLTARIGEEVTRCTQHFGVTFRQRRPETAVLVGGGATQPGVIDELSRITHLQYQSLATLIKDCDLIQLDTNQDSLPWDQLAESIGLALIEQMPAAVRSAA